MSNPLVPGAVAVMHDPTQTQTTVNPDSDPNQRRGDLRAILDRHAAEARSALDDGLGVDDVWIAGIADVLVSGIQRADSSLLRDAQQTLRRLASLGHGRTVTEDNIPGATLRADAQPPSPSTGSPLTLSLAGLETLLAVADAASASVRPRDVVHRLENGSLVAKILLSLQQFRPTANEEVLRSTGGGPTQVSRAFKQLLTQGLVEKRRYGREAHWILTTAGAAAAETLTAEKSPPPQKWPESVGAASLWNLVLARTQPVPSTVPVLVDGTEGLRSALAGAVNNVMFKWRSTEEARPASSEGDLVIYQRLAEALPTNALDSAFQSKLPPLLFESDNNLIYVMVQLEEAVKEEVQAGPSATRADMARLNPPGAGSRQLGKAGKRGSRKGRLVAVRHVLPHAGGGWSVRSPGGERASAYATTQDEAIKRAREILRNAGGGEVVIHARNGSIRGTTQVSSAAK